MAEIAERDGIVDMRIEICGSRERNKMRENGRESGNVERNEMRKIDGRESKENGCQNGNIWTKK